MKKINLFYLILIIFIFYFYLIYLKNFCQIFDKSENLAHYHILYLSLSILHTTLPQKPQIFPTHTFARLPYSSFSPLVSFKRGCTYFNNFYLPFSS